MALTVVNNVASLTAQNNLSKTSNTLSKSLEHLSSGLKINRGADGPAALVISEKQRAQISGLQTALDNTNKAVSLIQTGEGALNEITRLLGKVRSLAVDSANLGVNDSKALAANQEEIKNALDTIDKIATSTKFGTKKLFDGTDLTFQIGANVNQTASVTLGDVTAASLGKGAVDGIDSLNAIDVSSPLNARNNIAVIDQAISEIANQRSKLGAFQANTIETNANHLRASLENLSARTSVIRDTDFATEMAQFTKSQVMLQAGSTVLGNANQIPQLVASLLRG